VSLAEWDLKLRGTQALQQMEAIQMAKEALQEELSFQLFLQGKLPDCPIEEVSKTTASASRLNKLQNVEVQ
jgi:hypothetical protein